MDFETAVKLNIYRGVSETTRIPSAEQIAQALEADPKKVIQAFSTLHQKRLLVPEPEDPRRIRMAPPFSGIPTPFLAITGDKTYYANCAWDAFGISAALGSSRLRF